MKTIKWNAKVNYEHYISNAPFHHNCLCVGPQGLRNFFTFRTRADNRDGEISLSLIFLLKLTRAACDIFCVNKGDALPLQPPPHSNHPSAVKSHPGMKQKPSLWGMKAIELSFLSLMEQEGYRRSNVWGWVLLQACVVQVRGEGKIIYIYICSMPLAVLPIEMRQWTIHFYLFFNFVLLYHSCHC